MSNRAIILTCLAGLAATVVVTSAVRPTPAPQSITLGNHMAVVSAYGRRIVMTRAALRRYASIPYEVDEAELEAVVRHCEQPLARLVHAQADFNVFLYKRKPKLIYVSRSGKMI